jgi:hypothetical protein
MQQFIEMDCSPMQPRPTTYLPGVIKDTRLTIREPSTARFGSFIWDYSDIPPIEWQSALPIIEERITQLFNEHRIRYGAWQ